MPTLIILDPPLLACKLRKSRFYSVASNRDAKRKTLKNETGGEVKKEGKKKTRREVEWNNEEERKSEKNGNVGERKWRKKKGGNLRDRGMAFKRGGPFQVVWKLASFVFYTCICVTEVGGRD